MDNFNTYNGFTNYYQPTQTTAVPQYRNWQQYYSPVVSSPPPQSQQMTGNVLWVQGEAAARAYNNLSPGVPIALWDSEDQLIYIKSIDQNGKPQMTILRYEEQSADDKKEEQKIEYVTKEQIDLLSKKITNLCEKYESIGNFVTNDQLESLNGHINDLGCQIDDIEKRISSLGKPQQNYNSRKGNK